MDSLRGHSGLALPGTLRAWGLRTVRCGQFLGLGRSKIRHRRDKGSRARQGHSGVGDCIDTAGLGEENADLLNLTALR